MGQDRSGDDTPRRRAKRKRARASRPIASVRRRERGRTAALMLREGLFRALVEHAYDAIVLLDRDGVIRWASQSTLRVLGYAPDEFTGASALSFVHRDDLPRAEETLQHCAAHPGRPVHAELRFRHRNGDWRVIEGVGVNRLDDPDVGAIVANFRDVTERKRVELSLRTSVQRYALATRGSSDGLWDWDVDTGEIWFSPRWKELLGCGEDELADSLSTWYNLTHVDDLPRLKAEIAAHLADRSRHFVLEHRLLHRDGTYRWMLCRGLAVRGDDGTPHRMAGSLTDITDRKIAEERLLHEAAHDALTGLPNRVLLYDMLANAVARATRQRGYRYAVVFVDLDGFKQVNDSYGHLVGDQLLIAVARRIEGTVRPGDTVARLAGDEFTILLDGLRLGDDALLVCERVQRALQQPYDVGGRTLRITASIGVAIGPGRYHRPEDVLRDADLAMYRGKAAGGDRLVALSPRAIPAPACPAPASA